MSWATTTITSGWSPSGEIIAQFNICCSCCCQNTYTCRMTAKSVTLTAMCDNIYFKSQLELRLPN